MGNPLRPVAWGLNAVNALAAMSLLLVSGWFIAACALAGLPQAIAGFNYLLPAATIRMLAIVRIASGYGEKAVGHAVLLDDLQQLRMRLFKRVLRQPTSDSLRAEQLQRLNADIVQTANLPLAGWHPVTGVMLLAVTVTLLLLWLAPEDVLLWLGIVAIAGVALLVQWPWLERWQNHAQTVQRHWRNQLENELNLAPVWPQQAEPGLVKSLTLASKWQQLQSQYRKRSGLLESGFTLVAGLLLVAGLWNASPQAVGALSMLLVVALLAAPEWFAMVLMAQAPIRTGLSSRQRLSHGSSAREATQGTAKQGPVDQRSAMQAPAEHEPVSVELSEFSWQHGNHHGLPVTQLLRANQLVWLKGSSGAGKSSLLMAMAGLIDHNGKFALNGVDWSHHDWQQRAEHLHYIEQFPYVLSATLRDNLLLANSQANDGALSQVLEQVGLGGLAAHLDDWVGECGRQLSGGEVKRLGVARAILRQAPVLLFDEPFEGLDDDASKQLLTTLAQLKASRIILLASHHWPASRPTAVAADLTIDLDNRAI